MNALSEKLLADAAQLAAPCSAASPQGIDISYEADFDVVRVEIDKLTAMTGEVPNWKEIVSAGEDLVKTRSKDMRLLIWIAGARLKLDGPNGFARGLAGLKVVCDAHWEPMFPPLKRAKARGNLAGWLGDLALADIGSYEPKASDKEVFEAITQLFNDVDEMLSTRLADAYQGMGPIRTLLREKLRGIPADAPATAPTAAAAAAPVAAVAPAAATVSAATEFAAPQVPSVTGAADALPALRALGKGIVDVAKTLRGGDPASAFAYRLARTGTWLPVKQLPPAESGKTKIPPPQASDVKKVQGLFEQQQWSALVSTAEELASRFLFWLDLHRYVALGLERQGALYQEAHKAVVAQVLAFVEQQPGILGLSFADGSPFADEATKSWLEEQVAANGGGGGGGAGSARVDEEEIALRERFEEARGLVQGGKIGEGLGLALQLARRGADARARFRSRLETAALALKGGKPELARPLLDGLVREAETHGLEHWEPELCARLYEALLKARQGASKAGAFEGSLSDAEVFDRLCRLDPAAALRHGG